jgi:hypothetical protein
MTTGICTHALRVNNCIRSTAWLHLPSDCWHHQEAPGSHVSQRHWVLDGSRNFSVQWIPGPIGAQILVITKFNSIPPLLSLYSTFITTMRNT